MFKHPTSSYRYVNSSESFGYCAHVFITSLWAEDRPASQLPEGISGRQSRQTMASERRQARAIWDRLRSALFLQWRGLAIVTMTLADVIFFSVTFVYLDDLERGLAKHFSRVEPWLKCLIQSGGDKNACMPLTAGWLPDKSILGAVLIMLSLIGPVVFCLLFRWAVISAWKDYFSEKMSRKKEFVPLDMRSPYERPESSLTAQKYGISDVVFEMQMQQPSPSSQYGEDIKTRSPTIMSTPTTGPSSPINSPRPASPGPPHIGLGFDLGSLGASIENHYLRPSGSEQTLYNHSATVGSRPKRTLSNTSRQTYSSSRVNSSATMRSMGWDPTSTFATSGGGVVAAPMQTLHSTIDEDEALPGRAL